MPAWLRPSHPRFEPTLTALLVVLAEVELLVDDLLHTPRQALVAALVALPVALRFRAPVASVALTGLAAAVQETQVHDTGQVVLPTICLLAAGLLIRDDVTSDLVLAVLLPAAGLLIGRASGVLLLETEVLARERDAHTHDPRRSTRPRGGRRG